jgi:sugar phosphate permease
VIQYIRLGVMQGILFWLPSFLLDEKGLPLQVTGFIIATRTLLIAPSTILGGYISDRLRNPTAVMALSLIILAITTAGFTKVGNLAALMTLVFVNAIFVQSYFGPLFSIPVEKYGTKMLGTLSGFGNFYANLGGLTFTYALGLLKDRTGYFEAGFNTVATACVVGLVFTCLLERMRRAER